LCEEKSINPNCQTSAWLLVLLMYFHLNISLFMLSVYSDCKGIYTNDLTTSAQNCFVV